MRRVLITVFVLCFALVISACGQVSNVVDQSSVAPSPQAVEKAEETVEKESVVKNKEMTIPFSFGPKTGTYSGPVNEEGMPEGKGTFTSKNADGESWTYTGDFVNGHFEGEGEASWPATGYKEIGHYVNDVIQALDPSVVPKVYHNPDEYKFQCIDVSGKVYNIVDKNTFQMYEDIESSYGGNNTIVYYDSSLFPVKNGDFVKIKAIVIGEIEYQNVVGGSMAAVELRAKDIQETTYLDAAFPAIRSVDVNETQVQNGYSITINKIEFAETETRVYFSLENGGKNKVSVRAWDIEAEQNNRQYKAESRININYPQLPEGIRVGNIAEGIISFPPLDQSDFNVYIKVSSEDWSEQVEEMAFSLAVPPTN